MSQGKRFKFQGSSFAVQTALQALKKITAISKADPAVLSIATHGYAANDVLFLSNIDGMTELDEQSVVVLAAPSAGTVSLRGIDSTDYGTFVANSPENAQAQKVTFSDFCELTSFNQQDAAADEIDVTTICSTKKEYELGLSDAGSLTLEYNEAPNETVQTALRAAKASGDIIAIQVNLPKSGGLYIMFGIVQAQSISAGNGDVYKGTATIKLTGDLYVLAAA